MLLAIAKFHVNQESMVELNVGGIAFTISVSTLRSKTDTMLDAMLSGRYPLIRGADGRQGPTLVTYCRTCATVILVARAWVVVYCVH